MELPEMKVTGKVVNLKYFLPKRRLVLVHPNRRFLK
jgi:hypothetical protein